MNNSARTGVAVAFLVVALFADVRPAAAQVSREPIGGNTHHSWRLGADFELETLYLPGAGNFVAARLLSEPDPSSPLAQLNLHARDVIVRLDGTRVTDLRELDRHFRNTTVRFVRTGNTYFENGSIYINPGNNSPGASGGNSGNVNVP